MSEAKQRRKVCTHNCDTYFSLLPQVLSTLSAGFQMDGDSDSPPSIEAVGFSSLYVSLSLGNYNDYWGKGIQDIEHSKIDVASTVIGLGYLAW